MATIKKTTKKAQSGIGMNTKLRDVPKIAKDKITDLYGKASNRVKNATVRDAVDVAVPSYGLARRAFDMANEKKSFKPAMKDVKKQKSGGKTMLKRKDGSTSQRGLWDNIRAAKGSGKKPTAAMLKQEKKIKLTSKKK